MELKHKTILLISPESWGDSYVSKHHYANELVKRGNDVFFLNPPSGFLSICTVETGVTVVDYNPVFRGTRFLPHVLSSYLTKIEIMRIEKTLGVSFEVIWNFDSSRFFNLSKVSRGVLKICHLVDLNQDLQRAMLAKTSDICFGTTTYITTELKKHNVNSFKIGHAYQPPITDYPEFDFKMPGNNKIKALYVGNLSMKYIDWRILLDSASTFTDVDFVFVGPDGKSNLSNDRTTNSDKEKIVSLSNVFFQPAIHSKYIPQLLQLADFLLIAYQEVYHKDQAAPHKMLEYLASGKTILATYTYEFNRPNYYKQLRMSRRNKDYPALFKDISKTYKHEKACVPSYRSILDEIEKYISNVEKR